MDPEKLAYGNSNCYGYLEEVSMLLSIIACCCILKQLEQLGVFVVIKEINHE